MQPARAGSLLSYLAQVPDPRGRKGRRHPLSAMLTAVVCGFLCGHRGWTGLAEWLNDQPLDVCHWMGFTRWPPKKDCFRDLLMKLDPVALERAVRQWITDELKLSIDDETLQAVSIDGKTLRGSLRAYSPAVHLLAAVDHQTGCVLSQMRVDAETNEHKAALELLKSMVMARLVSSSRSWIRTPRATRLRCFCRCSRPLEISFTSPSGLWPRPIVTLPTCSWCLWV